MQPLSHDDYLALRAGAQALERDRYGDKVLALADGSYLKLFRRKRLISSAAWYPYAQRFADNALALAERGIPCPEVTGLYRIPSMRRDAVRYRPLVGLTLRHLIREGTEPPRLRERLGEFVASLHAKGVYFRSLHLGNIVLTPVGALGLIDFADLRAGKRPLQAHRRRRNLQHLRRDEKDLAWVFTQGGAAFGRAYEDALGLHLAGKG